MCCPILLLVKGKCSPHPPGLSGNTVLSPALPALKMPWDKSRVLRHPTICVLLSLKAFHTQSWGSYKVTRWVAGHCSRLHVRRSGLVGRGGRRGGLKGCLFLPSSLLSASRMTWVSSFPHYAFLPCQGSRRCGWAAVKHCSFNVWLLGAKAQP